MNILNELTTKNLKLNKKRTIVTIIGIILSTALICAVAGMVSSFQETAKLKAIEENGNRHITVANVAVSDLKYFTNNVNVKTIYYTEELGYAPLIGSKNTSKPYVNIMAYTKSAFENTTIKLVSGRLPVDENEIIISNAIINNGEVNLKVGDNLKLDIGKRKCASGETLTQDNPLTSNLEEGETDECKEFIEYEYSKEYKIVGIMERPSYSVENYSAPGYSVYTFTKELKDTANVSMLFKNPKYYDEYTKMLKESNILNKYSYTSNADLLRFSGVGFGDATMRMLMAVAGVVIGIIILTSVFVIKNSFDISIVEKTKQYGMLSSVGATSKQIKKNVLYEGFILGVIGIPLGILSGIFADFVLVQLINILGKDIFGELKFAFSVPLLPIVFSVILSAITILLSTIKTARKTSKIPPITAIRNNNEVKIKSKKLKCPKIISGIFGIGGEIAYKNLKRSKKKYRTTVISIVVSVSVFIALSVFINYGFEMTNQYYTDFSYNIIVNIPDSNAINDNLVAYQEIAALDKVNTYSIHRTINLTIDTKKYFSDEYYKYFWGKTKNEDISRDATSTASIISLGEEEYKRFIKSIGGNLEQYEYKGVLIDNNIYYDGKEEKYKHINAYDLESNKTISGTFENNKELSIEIIKNTDERPMGLEGMYSVGGFIIVSDTYMDKLQDEVKINPELYINTKDSSALEKDIRTYINNHPELKNTNIDNIDVEVRAQKSLIILVSIFLYGFIIVISLIGITNIFNTLTTNMNLRSKEFAMLKSIGMTKSEFNKMIRLESLMYGTKSLLIGIPLGILGGFLIYKSFALGNDMNYKIPISSIIISIVIVYLLVSIIMHFSLKKTRKQNIIETIRNENI